MMNGLIEQLALLLYGRLLIALLLASGVYFTLKTRLVQLRLLPDAIRRLFDRPEHGGVSSLGAVMVSTAARVGTGNIVGVSTAICLGGCGAVFWMVAAAFFGAALAFAESTLAQLYKMPDGAGGFTGGPAYYIRAAFGAERLSRIFCVSMLVTYGIGFNMLTAFNLQSSFSGYGFYDEAVTPAVIGVVVAAASLLCLLGGRRRIVSLAETLVPVMGGLYVLVSLIVVLRHTGLVGLTVRCIMSEAFDLRAAFSGFSGSCIMYGVRRGLFSNEAGVGSAPNAAAAADVSHPVKQGLAQMVSVLIDTLICMSTAAMCLCSGVSPSPELSGMPYVVSALRANFGPAGELFASFAMLLFAFTTILGNFFYTDSCLGYLLTAGQLRIVLPVSRMVFCFAVSIGACLSAGLVWDTADICMGVMCLINLPSLFVLRRDLSRCLRDYTEQRRLGLDPFFRSALPGWREKSRV